MTLLNPSLRTVTSFAPATCANVAVGFDILGFALQALGDSVTLTRRDDEELVITDITGISDLPRNIQQNVATGVIDKLRQDLQIKEGFSVKISKGIPLGSGMGGSAASAVAALVAFNAFLKSPLTRIQLAAYALYGEELATGQRHADNIAPCLIGGLTLTRSLSPIKITQLPIPNALCVVVHPHFRLDTHTSRGILKSELPLQAYVKQSANLAAFIVALYEKDLNLLKESLTDVLIEPYRAPLVPEFHRVKAAALDAGALGASLSGSGPSLFALARDKNQAEKIGKAMQSTFQQSGIGADYWCSPISRQAARITNSGE